MVPIKPRVLGYGIRIQIQEQPMKFEQVLYYIVQIKWKFRGKKKKLPFEMESNASRNPQLIQSYCDGEKMEMVTLSQP